MIRSRSNRGPTLTNDQVVDREQDGTENGDEQRAEHDEADVCTLISMTHGSTTNAEACWACRYVFARRLTSSVTPSRAGTPRD